MRCANSRAMVMACSLSGCVSSASSRRSRDDDLHERRVLLAAVAVAVAQVALEIRARDRGLDGEGAVAIEELHALRRQAVARGHRLAGDGPRALHALVRGGVVEHHVEGELEGPGILA